MNEHYSDDSNGPRKGLKAGFPVLAREAASCKARLMLWALDPTLWVEIPQGHPPIDGEELLKGRVNFLRTHRRKAFVTETGRTLVVEPDLIFTEKECFNPSPENMQILKGMVSVLQAFRAIGLAVVSSVSDGNINQELSEGFLKWRRELVALVTRHRTHETVMSSFKLALDWVQWRKMGNLQNTKPDSLPSFWWGTRKGEPSCLPFPKALRGNPLLAPWNEEWMFHNTPVSPRFDRFLARVLTAKRGFPPGDEEVCKRSLEKQREQLHQLPGGPWRENKPLVAHYARLLARKHRPQFTSNKSHVSVSTRSCWEFSVEDGGKNAALKLAWDRSLREPIELKGIARSTLTDMTGQRIYIPGPECGALPLAAIYLAETPSCKAGRLTLESTLESDLGGCAIVAIACQDLIRSGFIKLRGSVREDVPLWALDCEVALRDRIEVGPIPIPARVVTLPEEGWKGRTLSIPPWSYALVSACARHWFQDNLVAAEPRVGVGFESAYKLWDSVKKLGKFPTHWLKYPHVSGDVSQCTDSTPLEVHQVLMDSYLLEMERLHVDVPTCVWLSARVLYSPHIFVYTRDDGVTYTVEGDHQTGVMMGEGMSFIAMVLQNLTLDERVSYIERRDANPGEEPPIAVRPEGLTDIVGDDYLRLFCTRPELYSQLAWDWYAWSMSKGKNGVSYTCLQLAEEWGYARSLSSLTDKELKTPYGQHISKVDCIKIKYFAVPGPNGSRDAPAWVGRGAALAKHLDWCPDISKESKALLCDAFRQSYRDDLPKEVPLAWTLPPLLGGIQFPTSREARAILRRMKLDRQVQTIVGLPSWEIQATLRRLGSFHQPYGTDKGAKIPRFRDLDSMLGGFARNPSTELSHQPILANRVAEYLMEQPQAVAPKSGWKWNAALWKLAPSPEQVDTYMRSINYVKTDAIDAHALRQQTLQMLVRGETITRCGLRPRHGRNAQNLLSRVLRGVNLKNPLTEEGWSWTKDRWATIVHGARSPAELNYKLTFLMGATYINKDSAYAQSFEETFPWSFHLRERVHGALPVRIIVHDESRDES